MAKKSLKICFFHLAFIYSGGGERLVLQEMEGLARRGHQVVCYTPFLDKKKCFPDIIAKFDIRLIVPAWFARFLPRQSLVLIISLCWIFLRIKEFRQYDVFIGANQPGPLCCWLIRHFLKKPYLVYLAQPARILYPRKVDKKVGLRLKARFLLLPFLAKWLGPLVIWLDRLSVQGAERMLVNGSYMLSVLEQVYGREGVYCPAGSFLLGRKKVDKWQGYIRVGKKRIDKPFVFLSNRHFPQKKFEWAIEAFARFKRLKGLSLVISGGETPYTDFLKKKVVKMGLEDKVRFLGYVKNKDLERLYQNAVLYVYPAPEEDFGMGLVEAMGAGTPVVAWNYGGPTGTVIAEKTGILVEPYDVAKFAKAMRRLFVNKKLNEKMAEQAIEHVRENFSVERHVEILEENIYKGIRNKE